MISRILSSMTSRANDLRRLWEDYNALQEHRSAAPQPEQEAPQQPKAPPKRAIHHPKRGTHAFLATGPHGKSRKIRSLVPHSRNALAPHAPVAVDLPGPTHKSVEPIATETLGADGLRPEKLRTRNLVRQHDDSAPADRRPGADAGPGEGMSAPYPAKLATSQRHAFFAFLKRTMHDVAVLR